MREDDSYLFDLDNKVGRQHPCPLRPQAGFWSQLGCQPAETSVEGLGVTTGLAKQVSRDGS